MNVKDISKRIPNGVKLSAEQTYMTNTEGSSNKYYQVLILVNENTGESCVLNNYGPIGKGGSVTYRLFKSHKDATAFALTKTREKTRKGYKLDTPPTERRVTANPTHVFGSNQLNNEMYLAGLRGAFGSVDDLLNALSDLGAFEVGSEVPKAPTAKVDTAKLEQERTATYSTTWGEWA